MLVESTLSTLASPKLSSVMIPAWPPVNTALLSPLALSVFESTTQEIISPQDIRRSSSRGCAFVPEEWENSIKVSVA